MTKYLFVMLLFCGCQSNHYVNTKQNVVWVIEIMGLPTYYFLLDKKTFDEAKSQSRYSYWEEQNDSCFLFTYNGFSSKYKESVLSKTKDTLFLENAKMYKASSKVFENIFDSILIQTDIYNISIVNGNSVLINYQLKSNSKFAYQIEMNTLDSSIIYEIIQSFDFDEMPRRIMFQGRGKDLAEEEKRFKIWNSGCLIELTTISAKYKHPLQVLDEFLKLILYDNKESANKEFVDWFFYNDGSC